MPDFGLITRKRCEVHNCESECVGRSTAIIIIVLTATIAFLSSFLKSVGLQLSSEINFGFHITFLTIVVVCGWLLAIGVNAARRHDSVIWCLIDSIGFPAVLISIPEVAKYFGVST